MYLPPQRRVKIWKPSSDPPGTEPRTIILDGVDGASHPIFRFLQRVYFAPGVVMFAAARDPVALGTLSRLFWHPEKVIHFKLLTESEAGQLFDIAG